MSTNANPPSSSNPSSDHKANAPSSSSSLWRARNYRLWFAADTTDALAVSLRAFVIPLLALQLSGSEFIAGIIVALESAIGLLLLPFGGTLADRHDRRRMMILLGIIGTGLSATAMALLASRVMNTPMFALCIALFAIMNGLLGTAMGVSTLVGSLLVNKLVDMVPTGRLIAGALALFAVSQMPLLFLHSYAAILICQILAGLPFPALNAGLLSFLYGKTPDNMQGRASAVFETTVGILGAIVPAAVG